MTEPLSPAALATWNAFLEHSEWEVTPAELNGVAAVLRAAVDKIRFQDQLGLTAYGGFAQAQNQFLAIAAELEGGND
jgi:hypothetical protein